MSTDSTESTPVTVLPGAPEYRDDVQELFARTPCWYQYRRISAGEYGRIAA